MTKNELRFIELEYRLNILEGLKSRFTRKLEKNIKDGRIGTLAILNNWIKEIDEELQPLNKEVCSELAKFYYEQVKNKHKKFN